MQRALMQYFLPQNRELAVKALIKAGRKDLIGFGPDCLIRPEKKRAEDGARRAEVRKAPSPKGHANTRPDNRDRQRNAKPARRGGR